MKKSVLILSMFVAFTMLNVTAEVNYRLALKASCNTDGTDYEIENTMYQYGFNVDAYSSDEPTQTEKIKALFTLIPNQN